MSACPLSGIRAPADTSMQRIIVRWQWRIKGERWPASVGADLRTAFFELTTNFSWKFELEWGKFIQMQRKWATSRNAALVDDECLGNPDD